MVRVTLSHPQTAHKANIIVNFSAQSHTDKVCAWEREETQCIICGPNTTVDPRDHRASTLPYRWHFGCNPEWLKMNPFGSFDAHCHLIHWRWHHRRTWKKKVPLFSLLMTMLHPRLNLQEIKYCGGWGGGISSFYVAAWIKEVREELLSRG